MKENTFVTINDYSRLLGLMEFASLKTKMPSIASRLHKKLMAAKRLRPDEIGRRVVTMNSRVLLRDLTSKHEADVTITYPQEAEPGQRKVSVFSEIGTALIGQQEKDIVYWKVPRGTGVFEIINVVYQPEAAGHFHL